MYKKSEMLREVEAKITDWIKDFKKTQPGNVQIDIEDTFEGSAYALLAEAKSIIKEYREELENADQ